MYDELVKRLREAAEYVPCIIDREDAIKAANAIEELQEDNTALNGTVSNLIQQIEELSKQLAAEQEVCDGYYYAYQHWMHQYIKDIGDRDAVVIKKCVDCQRDCQMIGLDMPACTAYEPPKENE